MEELKQKSWFGRNWPWLIPVGGCLTVILLFVFGVGAIFFGVSNAIKNAAPYEYAINEAKHNISVQKYLGENIEVDGVFSGNISLKNNSGEADLEIPIKGDLGNGVISVLAKKTNKEWVYEKLYVLIKETQEEINLLEKDLEGI